MKMKNRNNESFAESILNKLPFAHLLPVAVVHWFLILVWAVFLTVIFVSVSLFSFSKIDGEEIYKFEVKKQTTNIKKKDLNKVLEKYKNKEKNFTEIKHKTYRIQDPSI